MFDHWATPVRDHRWAAIAVVLDRVKRASKYRLYVQSSHRAWERAVGVYKENRDQ